ncbi:MAG: NADH-quinone oxidoreductase subunit L [Bacteroidia bacterium]|nr:NADH-quinone oxidoreductase subunit L [Bacteroidia bacterium]
MIALAWLIPVFPLLGWAVNAFFGGKMSKGISGAVACLAVLASFAVSLGVFFELLDAGEHAHTVHLFSWIEAGNFVSNFSFLIDPLSSLFLLVITGIGFLIHVYSTGYMKEDEGHNRFFAYLNLFIFFMLLLVMGDNYLLMFVGWEGVGLCSYLLIGFWFKNREYNNAARKAFVMNRIGDLGFIIGILMIWVNFNSITYSEVFAGLKGMRTDDPTLIAITVFLFIGAMGKSAQIPLYTWLPDAMAGPTPVSALIHAATMVTAGIYMVARSNILYTLAPTGMEFVAVVGLITALFAATIGVFQNDIKKVLAYSTVSQLGYMFLGLGVGAYTGAVFHVMTHAFFKALLFLAAGSVIHALHHEQDIRKMGGLKGRIRTTFMVFAIGTIAISGIPPFSGFFSKDEILAHAFNHSPIYWLLGVIGSMLTAFYMFRLFYLTFFGKFRGHEDPKHPIHESPPSMTIPLIILAVLSVLGGLVGIPHLFGAPHLLGDFLQPVFSDSVSRMIPLSLSHTTEWTILAITLSCAGLAIYLAFQAFRKKEIIPPASEKEMGVMSRVVFNKYYVDEIYNAIITRPLDKISRFLSLVADPQFFDGIVNGMGSLVRWSSGIIRYVQSGYLGFYIFLMALGVGLILLFKIYL